MDLAKIEAILDAESSVFKDAVQTAIDEAVARRIELKSQIAQLLELDAEELSADDFFAVMDAFEKVSGNLGAVLDQAGFDAEVGSAWLAKEQAPRAKFRCPTLRMLLEVVIDYYADSRLFHDMFNVLERWQHLESVESKSPIKRELLLSKRLAEYNGYDHLSVRTRNAFKNDDVVTVGELVRQTEAEVLRTPNFGRKSLNETKAFLAEIGLSFGCLSEDEKDRVGTRRTLNENSGKLLVTKWFGSLKPEFSDLKHNQLHEKLRSGDEPCEEVEADAELLKALEDVGVTYTTELATAPKEVLDEICKGREGWAEQLPKLLQESKRPFESGYQRWSLSLHLVVPPYLDEGVRVYKES